eukprot:TCONS_00013170-protein
MSSFYMELLDEPLRFPPVSKEINVFFDECNKQVFAVSTEGGATKVQVKGLDKSYDTRFSLQDKGNVISLKFSPNHRILAIQRSSKSIDFMNFYEGASVEEYTQSCKGRSTLIIGFCWTSPNDIVFVTNQGIEFYQAQPEKNSLKFLKHYHHPHVTNWYVFLPESSVLLLSSGLLGNSIHPYLFKPGTIIRLPKFDVETTSSARSPPSGSLLERDVTVANIYNNIYVVILRNQPKSMNSVGAEIVLYQLQKDAPAKKTAVLRLGAVGRFAVNVVDNLVGVHHQASKTSMIFDINLPGDFDGQVTYYHPVLSPLPIEPFVMRVSKDGESSSSGDSGATRGLVCESYSANWVVFQPNIIIDAKLGCLWLLSCKLQSVTNMIDDKGRLTDFLLLRSGSKQVLVSVLELMLTPGKQSSISAISQIFDKINAVYAEFLELNTTGTTQVGEHWKENELTGRWFQKKSVLQQKDMYSSVFLPFIENESMGYKFIAAVLLEYIRSLNLFKIPVEYYMNEFIINLLVQKKLYYQLHQFLQYHVLSDSKPLACLLLSLESVYPCAYDLALDMMKRLGNDADSTIIETLLQKNRVISALKFMQSNDTIDSAAPRKFLSAAVKADDDMVFYTVFTFFQQRNLKLKKNSRFVVGDQCEVYERMFEKRFGQVSGAGKENEGFVEKLANLDL